MRRLVQRLVTTKMTREKTIKFENELLHVSLYFL